MIPPIGKPIIAREPSRAELESEIRRNERWVEDAFQRGANPVTINSTMELIEDLQAQLAGYNL